MIADDAGWFTWDEERIAAELYPYESTRRRERNVAKWATALEHLDDIAPHLVVYSCGHACVPKMPNHQRIAGTRSWTVTRIHVGAQGSPPAERCREARSRVSLQVATEPEGLQVATRSHGRVGKEVGNGTSREATPPNGGLATTEFQARVPRPFVGVGKGSA